MFFATHANNQKPRARTLDEATEMYPKRIHRAVNSSMAHELLHRVDTPYIFDAQVLLCRNHTAHFGETFYKLNGVCMIVEMHREFNDSADSVLVVLESRTLDVTDTWKWLMGRHSNAALDALHMRSFRVTGRLMFVVFDERDQNDTSICAFTQCISILLSMTRLVSARPFSLGSLVVRSLTTGCATGTQDEYRRYSMYVLIERTAPGEVSRYVHTLCDRNRATCSQLENHSHCVFGVLDAIRDVQLLHFVYPQLTHQRIKSTAQKFNELVMHTEVLGFHLLQHLPRYGKFSANDFREVVARVHLSDNGSTIDALCIALHGAFGIDDRVCSAPPTTTEV